MINQVNLNPFAEGRVKVCYHHSRRTCSFFHVSESDESWEWALKCSMRHTTFLCMVLTGNWAQRRLPSTMLACQTLSVPDISNDLSKFIIVQLFGV